MIGIIISLALAIFGTVMICAAGAVGAGLLVVFGDVILAVALVYGINKLFGKKKESKH